MGLDMNMYKDDKARVVEVKKYEDMSEIVEKLNFNHLSKNRLEIEASSNLFLERWYSYFPNHSKDILDRIVYQYCSFYVKESVTLSDINMYLIHDIQNDIKKQISEDFIESFSKFTPDINHINKIEALNIISDNINNMREEIAYWRKNHKLNSYILDNFGGGNCEDTILDIEALESIAEFIQEDSGEKSEVMSEIIENYDENYSYVYHPWW